MEPKNETKLTAAEEAAAGNDPVAGQNARDGGQPATVTGKYTVTDCLEGIDWKAHPTEIGSKVSPECHVGRVENFQIYLSEDLAALKAQRDDTALLQRTQPERHFYVMQLWSFRIKSGYDAGLERHMAVPTYDMLIPPTAFSATDVTAAKCECVRIINEWNEKTHADACNRFYENDAVFGNLSRVRSDKIVASLADKPVEQLGISAGASRALRNNDIFVIGALAATGVKALKAMPGIGDSTLNNILMCMKRAGIEPKD